MKGELCRDHLAKIKPIAREPEGTKNEVKRDLIRGAMTQPRLNARHRIDYPSIRI